MGDTKRAKELYQEFMKRGLSLCPICLKFSRKKTCCGVVKNPSGFNNFLKSQLAKKEMMNEHSN